jgi:hypothetical protein
MGGGGIVFFVGRISDEIDIFLYQNVKKGTHPRIFCVNEGTLNQ